MVMMTFAVATGLALAAWTMWLWIEARRAGHVVVVRVRGRDPLILGRQPHGRYELVGPVELPAVLARFEALRTAERFRAVRAIVHRPLRWHRTMPAA